MDAIERGYAEFVEVRRDGFIRKQHELFDQTMRDVALRRDDRFDEPLVVEYDLRFLQIEIDRAAPPASRIQDGEQLVHPLEHRDQRPIPLDHVGIALGQNRVHGRVGHALATVNDTVVHLVAKDGA